MYYKNPVCLLFSEIYFRKETKKLMIITNLYFKLLFLETYVLRVHLKYQKRLLCLLLFRLSYCKQNMKVNEIAIKSLLQTSDQFNISKEHLNISCGTLKYRDTPAYIHFYKISHVSTDVTIYLHITMNDNVI